MSEDLTPVKKVKKPCQTFYLHGSSGEVHRYYLESEADKVIAELEESHKKEVEQLLMEIIKKDEVIEHTVKGAISMFRESSYCRGLDTKSALGRIADVAFKHWNLVEHTLSNNRQLRLDKANLLRSNEDLHRRLMSETTGRQNDKIEYALNIRHHKYKRCLAMAKLCEDKIDAIKNGYMVSCISTQNGVMTTCPPECNPKFLFYSRWHKRWLEIAKKFKEAK